MPTNIEHIKKLSERIIKQAQDVVSTAEIPSEIVAAYHEMATQCKDYYNPSNIKSYMVRALIFALNAFITVESYGKPITENITNKFRDSIQELGKFSRDIFQEAKSIKQRTNEEELMESQKELIDETAKFIAEFTVKSAITTTIAVPIILEIGIGVAAGVAALAAVFVLTPVITAATPPLVATAVILGQFLVPLALLTPLLALQLAAEGVRTDLIPLVPIVIAGAITGAIYSIYQETSKFKEQHPDKNLTAKEFLKIIIETDHYANVKKAYNAAYQSAIESLTIKNTKLLESGFKKATVTKEVTKMVGKKLGQAVSNSSVGKAARNVKAAVKSSASQVKTKFTEKLHSKRQSTEQGSNYRSGK
jgi:hypothetical protein